MIINYDAFNQNIIYNENTYAPTLVGYDTVTFGNSTYDMKVAQIWGQWINITEDYLDAYDYKLVEWNTNTYLLATFSDSSVRLQAGNIFGLNGTIEKWLLYRGNTSDSNVNPILIATIDGDDNKTYNDYTVLRDNTYRYYVIPMTNNVDITNMFKSASIKSDYYGYFLIDIDNDIVYKFDNAVSGGDRKQNISYSSYHNNGKYQVYNVSNLKYMSSSISGLVNYANSDELNNTVDVLDNLRNCVFDNQRTKIFKDRKGSGYYVFTYDYGDSIYNQAIGDQPAIASFSWDEIGEL